MTDHNDIEKTGSIKPLRLNTEHFMDLYWGGKERRLTGIALRIIGVNILALLVLIFGIVYLGQYKKNVIDARLETFQSQLELIAQAIAENSFEDKDPEQQHNFLETITKHLSQTIGEHILVFDDRGQNIVDSEKLASLKNSLKTEDAPLPDETLKSLEILKDFMNFLMNFLPEQNLLPEYPTIISGQAYEYPDVTEALRGRLSVSVWQKGEHKVFLSAAAPLQKDKQIYGAVLLTRSAEDIENDLARIWIDVLKFFTLSVAITVVLSIYLSGTIGKPLKKLARAAQAVRMGHASAEDIPDFSDRFDEIGELSVSLREMTKGLWNRMDSIARFAADVSHELKNPLTSLKSATETLRIVKKPEDQKRLLEIIEQDIARLDRLITDISKSSRLDSELSREHFTKIDIAALLEHVLSLYMAPLERHHGEDKKSRINTGRCFLELQKNDKELIPKSLWIWGLEGRLGQVFENLLSNAHSFAPKDSTIKIKIVPDKQTVSVIIEDEGCGIPAEKTQAIFERFYSERPQEEDYGQHSGLGLSICQQIIHAHKGRIFAENILDDAGKVQGARFTVVLNRVPA